MSSLVIRLPIKVNQMSRMARREDTEVEWKPRTTLGMMVASGKINSMEQIFENGMRIQEAEIKNICYLM